MYEGSSGDGPDFGENSHRAGDAGRPKLNVWQNAKEDHGPIRRRPKHLSTIKPREDCPRSYQTMDNIDEGGGGRGYPGRPPSPGAASRVILEGPREDSGLLPKKKDKNKQPVFEPLRFTDYLYGDDEDDEEAERANKEKWLQKKAWAVTADAIRGEKGAYIIFAIRDFVVYVIFLSLLLMVAYGPQDNAHNYYASVLSDLITKSKFETSIEYGTGTAKVHQTFSGVRSIRQLWDFINAILVKAIYMDPVRKRVLLENVFVGSPSVRQIRVKKDTCMTAPLFRDMFKTCYGEYSEENEDKEPFGEGISSPWKYSSAFPADRAHGLKADYTSGGYIMNFTLNANFTINWLAELERDNWIGPGARAIIIDFTLYTPNTNLFLVVKLLAEVLPEGGVRTSHSFTPAKFMRYVKPYDLFVMSCEVMFFLFTIYFTLEELQQIWLLRKQYLSNWWNVLDLMIIALSFGLVITGIRRFQVTWVNLGGKLSKIGQSDHASFDDILRANDTFMLICSFLLFLVWLKLYKFASLNRSVILLLAAIDQVKWELLIVTFILMVIVTGFSILGLTLFGGHVDNYNGITHSFFSVISTFVGTLHYITEMLYARPTLTKLFIGLYSLIVGVIFLNTYIALVVYGYHLTHLAHDDGGFLDRQYMGDLVYSLYINILKFLRQYKLVKNYRMRDSRTRNKADYDAFVTVLKRYGWSLKELRLFLKSYRLYRGEEMDLNDLTEIYNDFWLRHQLYIEAEAHNEIRGQLNKIEKTIEFCEHAIVDIMSKTDVLADKAAKRLSRPKSSLRFN